MLHDPVASRLPSFDQKPSLLALCEPGGVELCIGADVRLRDAVEMFRKHDWLQILGVVDRDRRPVGLVVEQDVRAILYNPYGHALLDNPAFNNSIGKYVRRCPAVEADSPIEALFERPEGVEAIEGIIVVKRGRFAGLLSNRSLVRIAAERSAERQRRRLDRLEQTAKIGREFYEQVDKVSATLDDTMRSLAEQGASLAATMQRLRDDTLAAQDAAGQAVALADADGRRTVALDTATRAIDLSVDVIRKISREAHLLSINAAIEAARFGADAGGFGVVARELRQFASNTKAATATIDTRVEEIRAIAGDFTTASASVGEVVRLVDRIARGVDLAVGAEAEAAQAYAGNVAQAKLASGEFRDNVLRGLAEVG